MASFPVVLLHDELLHIGRVQLVPLVLRLDDERGVSGLVKQGLSGEAGSFTHGGLLLGLTHEVDVADLLEVGNERDRFGAHHLLVSCTELEPRVPEDVLRGWPLVGIL